MKHGKQPHCYVVAGPNGAGKTTFALEYLPQIVSCHDFINADEIAKGLSPLNYEAGLLSASKIFLETLDRKITERKDFSFETTLSGRTYLPRIVEWRKSGWIVTLFYLYKSLPVDYWRCNLVTDRFRLIIITTTCYYTDSYE